MRISWDYETFSYADLRRIGGYEYARHDSTDVLCLAYAFDDDEPAIWTPLDAEPTDLYEAIEKGVELHAWNSAFERAITEFVMARRYGCPVPKPEQYRCTMAKARAHALPGGLEDAAIALGTMEQKDKIGSLLMKKLSRPRKPTKTNPSDRWGSTEEFDRLFNYCKQDVRAERAISRELRELSPLELEVWRLDQEINRRGVTVDREMCERAIELDRAVKADLGAQLAAETGGAVRKASDRNGMIAWLKSKGVDVPLKLNAKGEEIETAESKSIIKLLQIDAVKRAVQLFMAMNKTSIAKYQALLDRSASDGRVREIFVYHGASTGRWAARGAQLHNMPRPAKDLKNMDKLAADIRRGDYEYLKLVYGNDRVLTVLSSALRGAITAGAERTLIAGDFSAVELRGGAWIANDNELLEVFRRLDADPEANWDVYTWQATQLLGREVTKADEEDRQNSGKVPSLGCFGPDTLVLTDRGPLPITAVRTWNRVWDGEEWVSHDGVAWRGFKKTIQLLGVTVTPDHLIKTWRGWVSAGTVARRTNILDRISAIALASGRSSGLSTALAGASALWSFSARAARFCSLTFRTSVPGARKDAMSADWSRSAPLILPVADMQPSFRKKLFARCGSIDFQPWYLAATPKDQLASETTAREEFGSTASGLETDASSSSTSRRFLAGTVRAWKSIVLTTTGITSRATSAWRLGKKTERTRPLNGARMGVFDLLNCGPRQRFTILTEAGPLIVHNCLYQMSGRKLVTYADGMGIKLERKFADDVVKKWRAARQPIVRFWKQIEEAAQEAVERKHLADRTVVCGRLKWRVVGRFLYCALPSGRRIAYLDPKIELRKITIEEEVEGIDLATGATIRRSVSKEFYKDTLTFMGQNTYTGKWERCTTYGGKLTENVVQAICRDLLVNAMLRLERAQHQIVLHVHDEAVSEEPLGASLEEYERIMSQAPEWADGFPMNAEGWISRRFRK